MPYPRPLLMRLTVPAHHMSICVMTEAWQLLPACPLWPRLQSASVHFVPCQSVCNTATRGAFFKHRADHILLPLPGNTEYPSVMAHSPWASPRLSLQSHLTQSFGQWCAGTAPTGECSGVCWQLETDHDRSISTREINKWEKSVPPSPSWLTSTLLTLTQRVAPSQGP